MPAELNKQDIDIFFDHYRDVFNEALKEDTPDINSTAELFSSCFIAADPSGITCGRNNEAFHDAMKKGYAFYRSIGVTSMDIVSKKVTLLDNLHTMVKVYWKSNFIKKDGSKGSIAFENIYFTQTRNNQHKVFAYITGDEQSALKSVGLL